MSGMQVTYSPKTVATVTMKDGLFNIFKRNGEVVIATKFKFLILNVANRCGYSNVKSIPLFLVAENGTYSCSLSNSNWKKHKPILIHLWNLPLDGDIPILDLINQECDTYDNPETEKSR